MNQEKKINKSKNIAELLSEAPESAEIMFKYGLHCVGCPASAGDSIEQGAKLHGLDDATIDKMVSEINDIIEQ